jgi:AcrR family transcriptional regulator
MTGRGPYAKSVEVKRGILEACMTAFGESGFHGVSMAEVARRAGISHTGLLHHFPNKEILLASVLTMLDFRAARYLEEHADRDGDDPLTAIHGLLDTVIGRRRSIGATELSTILPAEATAKGHPAHEHFRERYSSIRRFLSRQFRALLEQDRMNTALSPDQLAATIVAVTEGLQTQWLYEPGAVDIDGAVVAVLGAFIPELEAR